MKLRTEIEIKPLQQPIGCRDGLFVIGSCFADNIGSWLEDLCMNVCQNPFGTLYNPASIYSSFRNILNHKRFTEDEVVKAPDGMYYSFAHHGKFYAETPIGLTSTLNGVQEEAETAFFAAKHIIVTFGTAWVYEKDNQVVANCHKLPANIFQRRRLSVEEIVSQWSELIEATADKHYIFTVSPIRHVKDTLHGNQLSKATLLLAIDQLCQKYPARVEYIPVYELLIDDLRDYRFYAEDMVHPSTVAVELVKELFAESAFDKEAREYIKEVEPLVKASQHRPLHPESEVYKSFLCQNILKLDQLEKKYSNFGLEKLREFFEN